jgi:hypothetical protein
MMKNKSTENINDFNNNDEINNKINIINHSEKKNEVKRNYSYNALALNEEFFSANKSDFNDIVNNENRLLSKSIDNIGNNEKVENNENSPLIENKISEIMNNKVGIYKLKDSKLMLKMSNKLNRVSNNHTEKKLISLYDPLNQIISKEYFNLVNWLDDTHQQYQISSKNRIMVNNSTNTENKYLKINFTPKNNFYLSNKKINHSINRKRPVSCTNKHKSLFIYNYNNNDSSMNNNNNEYSYQKSPFNYNKLNKNNKYSKEVITQILTGDTINTQKLLKELDYEKYIKKIVGVRYRDHFVSYEEEKLVKLIDSYNIRDKIFNSILSKKMTFIYSLFFNK